MDTITTAATTYTPPGTSVVHNSQVSLTDRSPASVVHVVQYDNTLPIVAVALTANGQPYTVPAGAAVNVRLAKPDGTYVYNPALGVSEDAQTAYIGTTVQMTTAWGQMRAIVEVVLNGAVAGTGTFVLEVTENPVPEAAIESTSEFLTIQQLYQQIQQAATLLEEQSQNLQNVTDNLAAIQGAASNAQAAAQSAAEAAQSAQQALGFRTFFSAVSPDENGNLDPSRPMTTAAAQASWTVKSKGDRIQSVQVNGFTADGVSGGLKLYKMICDGSENWTMVATGTSGVYRASISSTNLSVPAKTPSSISELAEILSTKYKTVSAADTYNLVRGIAIATTGALYIFDTSFTTSDVSPWKQFLQNLYNAGTPLVIYYTPADESQSTGLYIPIQAQGHEYRCQCLPITEALGVGDNVQSNVPSGCDVLIQLDGSSDERWAASSTVSQRYYLNIRALVPSVVLGFALCDKFSFSSVGATTTGKFAIDDHYNMYFNTDVADLEDWKDKISQSPLLVWVKTSGYTEQADISVSLETHANGNIYAHDPVTLVAVPYTAADVAAANQLASTPSTLPYIDSPDVPMLLDATEPEQTAPAALAANAIPVAGTYVVSSQDGTTVLVSLKAMQDGGDAATLDGMTPSDLKEGGNAATLQGKKLSDICDLLVPVGFIFEWAPVDEGPDLSTPEKVAEYFGFGTWAAYAAGKVMAGVNSSHGIGTSVGAETHAITVSEMPSHAHNYNGWAIEIPDGGSSGNYALAKPYDQHNNFGMNTKSAGGGAAMSLMQPTTYVYIWQRIS